MSTIRKAVAFVLGLNVNGYGILRSLARKDIPVVGFYSNPAELGRHSKYGAAIYFDPTRIEANLASMLIDVRSNYDQRPVLFSASDEFTLLLAKQKTIVMPGGISLPRFAIAAFGAGPHLRHSLARVEHRRCP